VDADGRKPPFVSTSPRSNEVNSSLIVRPDAGVLIAVDRSSKQCMHFAESNELSLWMKGQGFTQATLVDNPLAALCVIRAVREGHQLNLAGCRALRERD